MSNVAPAQDEFSFIAVMAIYHTYVLYCFRIVFRSKKRIFRRRVVYICPCRHCISYSPHLLVLYRIIYFSIYLANGFHSNWNVYDSPPEA